MMPIARGMLFGVLLRGVYPGSFNPPTTAHLAIAAAAREQWNLDRIVLVHSRRVLGKGEVERPLFRHRVEVLEAVADRHEWLESAVTDRLLLADIAEGYDAVIMGADKWHQIHELGWYRDEAHRSATLARLPQAIVAPREPLQVPGHLRLDLGVSTHGISSTEARGGRLDLMAPAAEAFARRTGAWIDPDRYEAWLESDLVGPDPGNHEAPPVPER
ncbi:MAG: hypothetical protein OEU32_19855 [Acidimicrobiia bacterium]|nr:hypothetical protein [Acidimicrobiia bacterium]